MFRKAFISHSIVKPWGLYVFNQKIHLVSSLEIFLLNLIWLPLQWGLHWSMARTEMPLKFLPCWQSKFLERICLGFFLYAVFFYPQLKGAYTVVRPTYCSSHGQVIIYATFFDEQVKKQSISYVLEVTLGWKDVYFLS